MPASNYTRYPKLDATIKSRLLKQSKDADRPLARIQALLLDAVGLLTHLLEQQQQQAMVYGVQGRDLGNEVSG
jgi:hypothetical protein